MTWPHYPQQEANVAMPPTPHHSAPAFNVITYTSYLPAAASVPGVAYTSHLPTVTTPALEVAQPSATTTITLFPEEVKQLLKVANAEVYCIIVTKDAVMIGGDLTTHMNTVIVLAKHSMVGTVHVEGLDIMKVKNSV